MTVKKIIIRTIQEVFQLQQFPSKQSKTAAENHQRIKIGVKIYAIRIVFYAQPEA